jgi:hypothetical protein
VREVI